MLTLLKLDGSKILTYSKILRHCLLNSLKLSITFSISTQSGWDKSRSIDIKVKEDNLSWPIAQLRLHQRFNEPDVVLTNHRYINITKQNVER